MKVRLFLFTALLLRGAKTQSCIHTKDCFPGTYCLEGQCVVICMSNEDCITMNNSTPLCLPNGECSGCTFNQECTSANSSTPLCLPNGECSVGCTSNEECIISNSLAPFCLPNGECGNCTKNSDCPPYLPYCFPNICVQCLTNSECIIQQEEEEQLVFGSFCRNWACTGCEESDCTPQSLVCNQEEGNCEQCLNNQDCSLLNDGNSPICNQGLCYPCSQTNKCPTGQVCRNSGKCNQCEADSDCNIELGGLYCHRSTGLCQACQPSDCGPSIGLYCNSEMGICAQCENNSDCLESPALYCNNGNCTQCEESNCNETSTPYCNSYTGLCVGCLSGTCGFGSFCTTEGHCAPILAYGVTGVLGLLTLFVFGSYKIKQRNRKRLNEANALIEEIENLRRKSVVVQDDATSSSTVMNNIENLKGALNYYR